jgi:hypothetical protein
MASPVLMKITSYFPKALILNSIAGYDYGIIEAMRCPSGQHILRASSLMLPQNWGPGGGSARVSQLNHDFNLVSRFFAKYR